MQINQEVQDTDPSFCSSVQLDVNPFFLERQIRQRCRQGAKVQKRLTTRDGEGLVETQWSSKEKASKKKVVGKRGRLIDFSRQNEVRQDCCTLVRSIRWLLHWLNQSQNTMNTNIDANSYQETNQFFLKQLFHKLTNGSKYKLPGKTTQHRVSHTISAQTDWIKLADFNICTCLGPSSNHLKLISRTLSAPNAHITLELKESRRGNSATVAYQGIAS